jgi:hypothetical protein
MIDSNEDELELEAKRVPFTPNPARQSAKAEELLR